MKPFLKGYILLFSLSAIFLAGCESHEKREFNAGCQQGGLKRSTCSCIYDRLEQHYSPEVMKDMAHPSLTKNTIPADFAETLTSSTQQCISQR